MIKGRPPRPIGEHSWRRAVPWSSALQQVVGESASKAGATTFLPYLPRVLLEAFQNVQAALAPSACLDVRLGRGTCRAAAPCLLEGAEHSKHPLDSYHAFHSF
jgi:hypothetical protein